MFKKPLQNFASHQKGDTIHLLKRTASTKCALLFACAKATQHPQLESRPRRGKEDAVEKQIAGKWHAITIQEAIEYVMIDIPTNRCHVTHYGGCAILFNEDTFYPNIDVKSLYLHDTRRDLQDEVMEGDQGWVMQGVLSRASLRRPPLNGQKTLTVLSLHIGNIYAKKRGIAKKAHPHNPSHHDWSTY